MKPAIGQRDAAPADSGPSRLRLIIILGALTAVGPLSIDMYLPAFPEIAADFGATPAQVQLSLTTCLIGVGVGQLLLGPLSDAWGRRKPVLGATLAYAVTSLLCALAPSIAVLTVLRGVQGFAGGCGVVVARAVVRDRYAGSDATRFFSQLTLVFGLAPVLAPALGSAVLTVTSWRGVFVVLGVIGFGLTAAAVFGLPETLPRQRRRSARLGAMAATMAGLLRDRRFLGYTFALSFGFAALFAYISGSSFAIQGVYGASPVVYALIFGLNALGFVLASQLAGYLAGRVPEQRSALAGLIGIAGFGLAMILATATAGLPAVVATTFGFTCSMGLLVPNAISLAMAGHPEAAGTASALLGFCWALTGALAAPLVGLGPTESAVPMAVVVAGFAVVALTLTLLLARRPSPVS